MLFSFSGSPGTKGEATGNIQNIILCMTYCGTVGLYMYLGRCDYCIPWKYLIQVLPQNELSYCVHCNVAHWLPSHEDNNATGIIHTLRIITNKFNEFIYQGYTMASYLYAVVNINLRLLNTKVIWMFVCLKIWIFKYISYIKRYGNTLYNI